MQASDIVSVTISVASSTPTRTNFGVPLLCGHVPLAKEPAVFGTRLYSANLSGLSSLATDIGAGYATTWAYLAAQRLISQSPHCDQFAVHARSHIAGSRWHVTVGGSLAENDVFNLDLTLDGVALTQASATADATPLASEIITDLLSDIAGLTGVTGVVDPDDANSLYVTCTAAASRVVAVASKTSASGTITATDVSEQQNWSLTVSAPSTGEEFALNVSIGGATATEISYVASAGDVEADVLDALYTDLAAAGLTVTKVGSPTASLTLTSATTNTMFYLSGWGRTANITINDNSVDSGIATDLAAAVASGVSFFGATADTTSHAELAAAAVYCEAAGKVFVGITTDDDVVDSGSTTDVLYVLHAAGYHNSPIFVTRDTLGMAPAALMGFWFAYNPGRITCHGKTLVGVTADTWSSTQSAAITAKCGLEYGSVEGISMVNNGWAVSGRYLDITRGNAWLSNQLLLAILILVNSSLKVPNNALGRAMVKSALSAPMGLAASSEYQLVDDGWVVDVPAVGAATDTAANRLARILDGSTITCTLLGAIHHFTVAVAETI